MMRICNDNNHAVQKLVGEDRGNDKIVKCAVKRRIGFCISGLLLHRRQRHCPHHRLSMVCWYRSNMGNIVIYCVATPTEKICLRISVISHLSVAQAETLNGLLFILFNVSKFSKEKNNYFIYCISHTLEQNV